MHDCYQFTLLIKYSLSIRIVALDTPFLPKARRLVKQLESQHSKVHQEFVAKDYSISRSDQEFSRVSANTTLEQFT